MPNAQLGDYVFNIDPSSASWGYSLNVNKVDTYGGVVLQILSARIDDLVISGYIPLSPGSNRVTQFAEMEQFEKDIRAIMEAQAGDPPTPVRFSYHELGWNGTVYVMGFESVTYDVKTSAAKYTLRMTVDDGFVGVLNIDGIEGIDNIPDGINWVRNKYNTPSSAYTYEEIMEAIGNILDDIGTFDSLNPPTLYKYLDELKEAKEKGDGDTDDVSTNLTEAQQSQVNQVRSGAAALFTTKVAFGKSVLSAATDAISLAKNSIENMYANGDL